MIETLRLYRRLVGIQVRSQMQYRVSFILDVIAAGVVNIMGFATLVLTLQRFGGVAGWTVGELAFLCGTVECAFGLMDMLFSGFDPDFFANQVRRGGFDQILIRPISVVVQVLGSAFILRRLGRILEGLGVMAVALAYARIEWNWIKILYLPMVIFGLVAFFGGLFIIGSTITFWTIERIEAMNIFTYGGAEMMSYPMSIYQNWLKRFFTFVLPAIFLNYYPALYFLDRPELATTPKLFPFLSPLAGLFVLGIALLFWQYGLRRYQSTGT